MNSEHIFHNYIHYVCSMHDDVSQNYNKLNSETWTYYNDEVIFDSDKVEGNAFPKLTQNDNIKFNWKRASVLNMPHRHGLIPYANIWPKSCEADDNITICILNTKYVYVHFPTYPTLNFQCIVLFCVVRL